jgi:hypothetical protein
MKDLGAVAMSLLYLLLVREVSAETYRNTAHHYAITFGDDWKRREAPEGSSDLILLCINSTCGKSTSLEIGARYFPQIRDRSAEDFLKNIDVDRLTQLIQQMPQVEELKILHEGRTTVGVAQAYEVVIEFRYREGAAIRQRIMHTFVTFDRGNVYKISFYSYSADYERDFALARDVLATFAIQE